MSDKKEFQQSKEFSMAWSGDFNAHIDEMLAESARLSPRRQGKPLENKYGFEKDTFGFGPVSNSAGKRLNEQGANQAVEERAKENEAFALKVSEARTAGRIEGICQAVNIVKRYDLDWSKSYLKERGVTKNVAAAYARPETFSSMKSDIFQPKAERKLEHSHGRGR